MLSILAFSSPASTYTLHISWSEAIWTERNPHRTDLSYYPRENLGRSAAVDDFSKDQANLHNFVISPLMIYVGHFLLWWQEELSNYLLVQQAQMRRSIDSANLPIKKAQTQMFRSGSNLEEGVLRADDWHAHRLSSASYWSPSLPCLASALSSLDYSPATRSEQWRDETHLKHEGMRFILQECSRCYAMSGFSPTLPTGLLPQSLTLVCEPYVYSPFLSDWCKGPIKWTSITWSRLCVYQYDMAFPNRPGLGFLLPLTWCDSQTDVKMRVHLRIELVWGY